MKSTLLNMILVLGVITFVAAAAVAGVYQLTLEPIQKAMVDKTNAAIAQVVPAFDNNPSSDKIPFASAADTLYAYPAKQGNITIGYAIETITNEGFAGRIKLMVGILANGNIHSISVLEQAETPGLGDKIEPAKSNFSLQFQGKSPESMKMSVRKDGGDVDAITASTISSRAYLDALNRAYEIFYQLPNEQ